MGSVQPQPAGRRRGGQRRPRAGRGLARGVRRPARRGQRDRRRGDADLRGATLYVSLEPCCHQGQHAAVHRRDPRGRASRASSSPPTTRPRRPRAAGLGILRDEGVEVDVADGELAARARLLNQALPQARAHRAPVGALQVGDDARRQGRDPDGRLEVDLERGQPRSSRTTGAPRATPSSSASAPRWPTTRSSPRGSTACATSRGASSSTPTARLPLDSQLVSAAHEVPLIVVVSRAARALGHRRAGDRRRRRDRRHRRARARARALGARPARRAGPAGHLDPARGRPAPGRRLPRRRRDRRAPALHRPAAARRPLGARPARGRGRRARSPTRCGR